MAKRAAKRKSTSARSTVKRKAAGGRSSARRSVKRTRVTRAKKKTAPRKRAVAKRAVPRKKVARRKTAARAAASRSTRTKRVPEPSRLASAATTVRGVVAGAVAAVAERLPWSSAEDAIALLEKDHRRFEDLLKRGAETTERAVSGRTALLNTLTDELNAHELVEEKILYPALKEHPEAKDIVLEGYQEHHVADILVKELHGLARDDEKWGAKFKVLTESLEHHIKEEERKMFVTARGIFSREDLLQMGTRMVRMKGES